MKQHSPKSHLVYLITGMSGAGRSTALQLFEDLGFEAVDNLPIFLLPRLIKDESEEAVGDYSNVPLAIGIDIRSRQFDAKTIHAIINNLQERTGRIIRTIFLDCDTETLINRYKQTRRPHPLALDRTIADGVKLERQILSILKQSCDIYLDTSGLTVWHFRERLKSLLADRYPVGITISILSFSFAKGLPRDADIILDVRFLQNPYYIESLRPLCGLDTPIGEYIAKDKDWKTFFSKLQALFTLTLPRYQQEGKSNLTIAIGCTGGRHRSVFVAESLGKWLKQDWNVYVLHQELNPE